MENITVRLAPGFDGGILRAISNANPTGGIRPRHIEPRHNAAFGAQPQGYGKDMGRRIDWQEGPVAASFA
jgi:hypothetical protein